MQKFLQGLWSVALVETTYLFVCISLEVKAENSWLYALLWVQIGQIDMENPSKIIYMVACKYFFLKIFV